MNRELILKSQPRSYMEGTIFFMNNEWIFFDNEDDEAYLLDELTNNTFEIFISNTWVTATIINHNEIIINHSKYLLIDGMKLKIPKSLQLAYQNFLDELSDQSFQKFTTTLDELEYSLFDCMICHHYLSFMNELPSIGVNFFLFDNADMICSIHHHFIRNEGIIHDRFEFTRADGIRIEIK